MNDAAPSDPPKNRRSRRRLAFRIATLAAALLALGAAAILVAPRFPWVRQALLDRVSGAVEAASGVRFTADDFSITWRHAAVELRGVELAASGERPFLTIPHLRAEVRLLSFLSRRWTVRTLEADSPRFDLGAPLPQPSGKSSEPPGRTVEILRLAVAGGAVDSSPESLAADSWLESWRLEGIELQGSYQPQQLVVDLSRATLEARRRNAAGEADRRLAFEVAGRLRGAPAGPYEIESLTATGDGLELTASGRAGFGADAPLAVVFELTADPARWITGRPGSGGRVEGEGDLDLRGWSGTAHWRGDAIPAELVEPWLGRATMERMGAAGSFLDLEGDVELDPAAAEELAVRADLAWRRGALRLGEAKADVRGMRIAGKPGARLAGEIRVAGTGWRAELLEPWLGADALGRAGAAGTHLDFDGRLVLGEGTRDTVGRAEVHWQRGTDDLLRIVADTTGGVIGTGGELDLRSLVARVGVEGTDLPAELAGVWLAAGVGERLGTAGTRLDLEAALTVEDLTVDDLRSTAVAGRARAVWRDESRTLLEATAEAPERSRKARWTIAAEALPASPGRRRLEAELDWRRPGVAEIAAGRLELEAPDLAAAVAELRAVWPQLVPEIDPRWPVEGSLSLAADLAGTVTHPEIDGEASWRRDQAVFTLAASGEPFTVRGQARLTVADLDLAGLRELTEVPGLSGRAEGVVEVAGSPSEWTGELHLEVTGVASDTPMPRLDELTLDADSDGTALRLTRLSARAGERTLTGHGELAAAWPLRQAEFQVELGHPIAGVDRVLVDAGLADGILMLKAPEIDAGGERGELLATIPLGALRAVSGDMAPELGEMLASLPAADGEITLSFSLPRLDAAALLADLDVAGVPATVDVAARGELTLDLDDLTAARGTVEIPRLAVASEEHRLDAGEPLRLQLAGHRLEGAAPRLNLDGRALQVTAAADLRPGWRPEDPLGELATSLDATATGAVEADLLNPYLGGAVASGPLQVELTFSGPPDRLGGQAKITGPEARLVARSPYFTRLENPEAEIEIEDGEAFLTLGRVRLNQGVVELTGFRERDGEIELYADLENVRYRLDYGLGTTLSAELTLSLPGATAPPAERGRLSGRLIVDRGLVRRDLNFEREIVGQLLAPAATAAADPDDPLAAIDLDLDVATVDGVRVKNNLADLRATWSPLVVRGTLAAPLIDGRLDVEPGGFVYVLGQTARIDQATVFLRGFPEVPPELEVDMTTSLEDPAVAREGADRFAFAAPQPALTAAEIEDRRQQLLTAGVASYYADQLAGRFGQVLGGIRIEVAPLLVFGETDPGARLTVSRDLSSHVAFAVSVDLNAENRQTYLLDLHDFRPVPSLAAQLFTNDERHQGVTLQQNLTFGGSAEDETRPRIRGVRVEAPAGFDGGGVRGAADLGKGDRFPEGAEFDVEVDVAEHLRQRGYPGAEVDVRVEEVSDHRVDLVLTLAPGPEVTYDFRGDALPRAVRRTIRRLYRIDVFEQAAIEDMRREAVRALRDLGHPEPEVEVAAIAADPADPAGDRTVVIDARGGERRPIAELELRGIPPEVAAEIGAGFAAQGDRIELSAALEDSDRRLLGMLRRRGYPEAEIAGRRLEHDGKTLIVELAAGRRLRIVDIRIEGITAESVAADRRAMEDRVADSTAGEEARLRKLLPLAVGDPVRSDRVARGTLALEGDLRGRGYADARAWAITAPRSPDAGDEIVLTYRLEPGPRYRIQEIRFDGAEATQARWAERVADLDKGAPLDPSDVGDARRRLFNTGLFRSVVPDTEHGPDGDTTVVFDLRERPRFQLSYGLRWESSQGGGVVADAVDRNAFGRGVTLGLRSLWSADEWSARAYSAFPKVFGTRATAELFAERGESRRAGRFVDRTESTFQVSFPLSESTTTRGYLRYRNSLFQEPVSGDFTRVKDPILGWQLVRDTRNDKIDASRGLLASADVTGAGASLGGDSRFLRFLGKLSVFRPITRGSGRPGRRTAVTWAQSVRLGWAEAFGGQVLSPDERFFAGGELSVRGYGNDSLGPVSATGVPLGGEALLVVNQELRFPLWESIRGLLFVDAGNVWQDAGELDFDFFTAAGLGLRVSTPVGLVRFDVALPLDRRPQDDGVTLYLGLGNVF